MDNNGVANLFIAVYRQAFTDYEKGKKILIRRFGKVISENEFFDKTDKHAGGSYDIFNKIARYFDAIRFMMEDPYGLYGVKSKDEAVKILDKGFWGEMITQAPTI